MEGRREQTETESSQAEYRCEQLEMESTQAEGRRELHETEASQAKGRRANSFRRNFRRRKAAADTVTLITRTWCHPGKARIVNALTQLRKGSRKSSDVAHRLNRKQHQSTIEVGH